jgi:hypothetical protein
VSNLVVNIILLVVSAGFAAPVIWIVYGFIGNGAHKNSLLKKDYLPRAQREAQSETRTPTPAPAAPAVNK